MAGPKLRGLARRVKRVRQEQETIRQAWLRSREHGGQPSAIGLAAQEDASRNKLLQNGYCAPQTFPIFASISSRRSMRASLAKRQVAAKDCPSSLREFFGQRHEEWRIAVPAGSVG